MFGFIKRKEEKKQKDQAFYHAQLWRSDPRLQECFSALRGWFTVALAMHQEAAEATISIANAESGWVCADAFADDWLAQKVFVLWSEPTLPVLQVDRDELLENLASVITVAPETYLVSETFDRVVHFRADGSIELYSVA